MAGSRADDDPWLENIVELLFLCPKLSVPEATQVVKFMEEESISPCFKMRVCHCMNIKKKLSPIGIVSSETAASTIMDSPKKILLN